MTIKDTVVSTSVRTNAHVASSTPVSSISTQGVVPPPQPMSLPFNPYVIRPTLGDPRMSFLLSFMLPMGNREYSYYTPIVKVQETQEGVG